MVVALFSSPPHHHPHITWDLCVLTLRSLQEANASLSAPSMWPRPLTSRVWAADCHNLISIRSFSDKPLQWWSDANIKKWSSSHKLRIIHHALDLPNWIAWPIRKWHLLNQGFKRGINKWISVTKSPVDLILERVPAEHLIKGPQAKKAQAPPLPIPFRQEITFRHD